MAPPLVFRGRKDGIPVARDAPGRYSRPLGRLDRKGSQGRMADKKKSAKVGGLVRKGVGPKVARKIAGYKSPKKPK